MNAVHRVLVVDDHELFREGIKSLIERWDEFEVLGAAADGKEAIALATRHRPDLILMDVRMRGMDGVTATRMITAADPRIKVVMLTMSTLGEDVFEALRGGAVGYISKNESPERLRAELLAVMDGESAISSSIALKVMHDFDRDALGDRRRPAAPTPHGLAPRERDVLRLVVEGLSNEEIAGNLHLSVATIKKVVASIMTKFHLRNRVQVAVYGVRQGILE